MSRVVDRVLGEEVVDAYSVRIGLGDRALDLNSGMVCDVLDHCPELGPESLYVQITEAEGPVMTYWVEPSQLMKLPNQARE